MKTLLLAGLLGSAVTLLGWVGGWIDAGRIGAGAESRGAGGASEPEAARTPAPATAAVPARASVAAPAAALLRPDGGRSGARSDERLLERLEEVVARLEALDAKVDVLGGELARLASAHPVLPAGAAGGPGRAAVPETDWIALEILREDHGLDSAALASSVRFLTSRELLERYGAPTRLDANEGETRWIYRDEARGLRVTFSLLGDYVTDVRVLTP